MPGNPLTDPLLRSDLRSQELAYNNNTDRMKVELPQFGDPAASGCVAIITPSGTNSIPVYLTSPLPVAVAVDIESDSIKVWSASGTATVPVYIESPSTMPVTETYSPVYIEDTSHVTGDKGVPALAVRNDTIGPMVSSDGDYANLQLSAYGGLRTQLDTIMNTSIDMGAGEAAGGTMRVAVASGVTVDYWATEHSWATLSAPGNTEPVFAMPHSKHTIQYTVASIDTSVTVGAYGSLDGTSWFNLDANDTDTTQTLDGTYGMIFDGMTKYIVFSFVSEAGGTSATISAKYLGGH